jgi:hypothetical protein
VQINAERKRSMSFNLPFDRVPNLARPDLVESRGDGEEHTGGNKILSDTNRIFLQLFDIFPNSKNSHPLFLALKYIF